MVNKIQDFLRVWAEKGDEKQHTQSFWITFLRDVVGVSQPEKVIDFEKRVKIDNIKYIDAYIAETRVAIEQKGAKIDLDKPEKQSDGEELTPFEQAKRYNDNLPFSEKCRWIVVCNFKEFRIHDMDKDEPIKPTIKPSCKHTVSIPRCPKTKLSPNYLSGTKN